jgi:ATP-dependent DNA helicase RecG
MFRNPGIANLFQRIDYIEKMGTGIERIRLELKKAKVPQVQYELMPVYVRAIFPRPEETEKIISKEDLKSGLGEKLVEKLGENERKLLMLVVDDKFLTIQIMAQKLGVSTTAVENILKKLKQKGILMRIGPDKGGYWEVNEK